MLGKMSYPLHNFTLCFFDFIVMLPSSRNTVSE